MWTRKTENLKPGYYWYRHSYIENDEDKVDTYVIEILGLLNMHGRKTQLTHRMGWDGDGPDLDEAALEQNKAHVWKLSIQPPPFESLVWSSNVEGDLPND